MELEVLEYQNLLQLLLMNIPLLFLDIVVLTTFILKKAPPDNSNPHIFSGRTVKMGTISTIFAALSTLL